jgi:hypothetical protein
VLDAFVMSPSNHRVHHARNARYIDRNFGGSLVLWDKLFGTYQPEDEAPVYGVTHLPPTRSAITASMGGFPELAADVRAAGGFRPSVRIAFGRPDWEVHDRSSTEPDRVSWSSCVARTRQLRRNGGPSLAQERS